MLLDLIRYTAKDSVKINQKTNKIRLYNEAKLEYQDMELTAGLIVLDYTKNEVYAGRIADSTGTLTQNLFLFKVVMKLIQILFASTLTARGH